MDGSSRRKDRCFCFSLLHLQCNGRFRCSNVPTGRSQRNNELLWVRANPYTQPRSTHIHEWSHFSSSLNELTLEFVIHAIQLKNQRPFSLPDCYRFLVKVSHASSTTEISYRFHFRSRSNNNARTGKIRQHLNSQAHFRTCNRQIIDQKSGWTLIRRDLFVAFDCLTLLITSISFVLCVRSLSHGHVLCGEVRRYYSLRRTQEPPLAWSDIQVFYSFWYFLMIATDLMVIPGTIIKIGILFKVRQTLEDDFTRVCLARRSIRCRWSTPGFEQPLSLGFLSFVICHFFRKYNVSPSPALRPSPRSRV